MDAATELETLWASRGIEPKRVDLRADGTVGPRRSDRLDSAVASGETLSPTAQLPDGTAELTPGRELGRGGRGIVVAARQRSLRREVALKRSFHPGMGDLEVLEEGWALAHLAHPNVVPVHALVTIEGRPALAMKRIVGRSWAAVLSDARTSATEAWFETESFVESLRVLIEVTRAVEHAHRSGVVHLDLKPSNVMVGQFGEVYLLDWGLAARLGDEPAHLPAAAAIDHPAGTPAYMAPEQAEGSGRDLGVATDIYLLGAILYEVLSGDPPHPGASHYGRMLHAIVGEIAPASDGVPKTLDALARTAMARSPTARCSAAADFRAGIEAYLREREGERLLTRASAQLAALEAAIAAMPVDRDAVQRHFGAGRFAAREALRELGGRRDAENVDHLLHVRMIEHAVRQGDVALADATRREIDHVDADLDARIDAAREADARDRAHRRALDRFGRDQDLALGSTVRATTVLGLASIFSMCNFALGFLERSGRGTSYREMLAAIGIGVAFVVPYAAIRRKQLFPNRVGSAFWGACIALVVPVMGHWFVCASLGVPYRAALCLTPVYYLFGLGALATFFDSRIWPAAAGQLATLVVAVSKPEWAYEALAIGGGSSLALVAHAWRGRR